MGNKTKAVMVVTKGHRAPPARLHARLWWHPGDAHARPPVTCWCRRDSHQRLRSQTGVNLQHHQ